MFRRIRKLREAGVVGINQRNRTYIMAQNPRHLYALVDDKVRTKKLANNSGIAVPELYHVIDTPRAAQTFRQFIKGKNDFVIKPARGSGGNGILVITEVRGDKFIKADGSLLTDVNISHHIQNILGGVYSLGGQPDQAIIEYRVKSNHFFEKLSYRGVPDIRVLVYRGVPAMAMLRLPTRESDGRANLHQGAVGVGINMTDGYTVSAVSHNRKVTEHPDFGTSLINLKIPHWQNILLQAARCQELAPLGYLGVDIVLDETLGAMMLELNARPGLAIQIANGCGLKPVLDTIDETLSSNVGVNAGARCTVNLLAGEHNNIAQISGDFFADDQVPENF